MVKECSSTSWVKSAVQLVRSAVQLVDHWSALTEAVQVDSAGGQQVNIWVPCGGLFGSGTLAIISTWDFIILQAYSFGRHWPCIRLGLSRTIYIFMVYTRCFWQGNHLIYGHIRCMLSAQANPGHSPLECCCCMCEGIPSRPSFWE